METQRVEEEVLWSLLGRRFLFGFRREIVFGEQFLSEILRPCTTATKVAMKNVVGLPVSENPRQILRKEFGDTDTRLRVNPL
jgi:hypothetical protein